MLSNLNLFKINALASSLHCLIVPCLSRLFARLFSRFKMQINLKSSVLKIPPKGMHAVFNDMTELK